MNEQLNHIPCGYLTFTKEGTLLSINHTLLDILGYSEEQVIGQHFNCLLADSAKVFTQLYFFPLIINQKQINEMYVELISKDGECIPVLMNASLSNGVTDQTITCIMIRMKNRNEYENKLIMAKQSAEDAFNEMSKTNVNLEQTLKALKKNKQKLLKVNNENETFKTAIQKELTLAKKIQAESLPQDISTNRMDIESFYLASGELSGDIFGYYPLNEHQYGIIILDVMGQGISSALITMSLQSLFQMLITKGTTSNAVMKELDTHLHTLFQHNEDLWHYSTGICLIIDTNKQTIECTNAGHPPAIFQDAKGNQIELGSTTPPIGTFEGMDFKVDTLTYEKGSRILLYTDGVSEPLGCHRLSSILREYASDSLVECKKKFVQAIQFEGEEGFKTDDRCFILVDLK